MYEINSLRQYPAPSHDAAFEYLSVDGLATISRYHYEVAPNPTGAPRNAIFLGREVLVHRDDLIVLGAEPYDKRVPVFDRLARRHNLVLHTSWPYWGTANAPQSTSSERRIERWADFLGRVHVVGVTEAATEAAREFGAREASHIPHGIDTDVYRPGAGQPGDERDRPVVLFVGRLERRKGVAQLLEIAANWTGPEVTFRFVGDGPLADDVAAAARGDRIEYMGYVGDDERLASLYATSDALALPSYAVPGWEELFGIVVIEAQACGLPVVAADCVGPREIVDDETGFVVPQHDTDALAERLRRVVSDDGLRERLGEQARERAESEYDWTVTAEQWAAVFDDVRGA
jgi:glycosyltransferase involved in cell wall biosynthesis